jgi:hypothetical protein
VNESRSHSNIAWLLFTIAYQLIDWGESWADYSSIVGDDGSNGQCDTDMRQPNQQPTEPNQQQTCGNNRQNRINNRHAANNQQNLMNNRDVATTSRTWTHYRSNRASHHPQFLDSTFACQLLRPILTQSETIMHHLQILGIIQLKLKIVESMETIAHGDQIFEPGLGADRMFPNFGQRFEQQMTVTLRTS